MEKRKDYISWEDYFMGVALLAAKRSKDPSTQVGVCIVEPQQHIIQAVGYNGMPRGCSDDEMPWSRQGIPEQTKYPYVVHAELNAILNAQGKKLPGCILYTTLFPCNECAKAIIQVGIKEVIYLEDKYKDTFENRVSKLLLEAAGIKYHKLQSTCNLITLTFKQSPGMQESHGWKHNTLEELLQERTVNLSNCCLEEVVTYIVANCFPNEDISQLLNSKEGLEKMYNFVKKYSYHYLSNYTSEDGFLHISYVYYTMLYNRGYEPFLLSLFTDMPEFISEFIRMYNETPLPCDKQEVMQPHEDLCGYILILKEQSLQNSKTNNMGRKAQATQITFPDITNSLQRCTSIGNGFK